MLASRSATAVAVSSTLMLALGSLALASGDRGSKPTAPTGKAASKERAAKAGDERNDPTAAGERECDGRMTPLVVMTPVDPLLIVGNAPPRDGELPGGTAGACPQQVSQWTSSDFGPGTYILQGGFAEHEMAGTSYVLTAADFPLRIDLTEMIFGTSNASVQTTTQWSVLVYEGTPSNGQLVYSFSSDGDILPHIVLPPGTSGVNVQFMIDPGDPEQMWVYDNGSHTFSVAYRIDKHNNQTQNPCFFAPPANSNAFPATDVGGLASLTGNWLYAIDCGILGCPAGWHTFGQLPSACRPSGDWVMRVTWTPLNCQLQGACCFGPNNCQFMTQQDCESAGGSYQGDNVPCGIGGGACASTSVACCFQATGGCLNLTAETCVAAGGVPGPSGSNCTGYVCFPTGACCLPNGNCIGPVSPETCAAQGGTFQGNNTSCASTNCPLPTGGCCFPNGFCLTLTEADCQSVGATWHGPGTNCADTNGNGHADVCESNPADLDGDGHVGATDLAILLGKWGQSGQGDINGDGTVNAADLSILLGAWG